MTIRDALIRVGFDGTLLDDVATYYETNYPSSTEDCAALAAIATKHGEDGAELDLGILNARILLSE